MSRTALPGYPLDDVEKDFFVALTKDPELPYFVEILGCCCMGNLFHLRVGIRPDSDFSDAGMMKRLAAFYREDKVFGDSPLPHFWQKLSSLSEFVREIKVGFARFYNNRLSRWGDFWGSDGILKFYF
jgi:putative transposase